MKIKTMVACACAALLLTACGAPSEPPIFVPVTPPPGSAPTDGLTPEPAPTAASGAAEFSMEDLVAGDLRYGAYTEDVRAARGDPDEMNEIEEGATGNYIYQMRYADGAQYTLTSAGPEEMPALTEVSIEQPGTPGPRGIQVGDTREKLLSAFRNDGDPRVLYAAEVVEVGGESLLMPPRGYITDEPDDQDRTEIWYDVPVEPYGDLASPTDFVYERHAMVCFYVKDDQVVAYRWVVGAMAE